MTWVVVGWLSIMFSSEGLMPCNRYNHYAKTHGITG